MLKQALADALTARALRFIPGLVGDLWGGARVPVWVEDLDVVPIESDAPQSECSTATVGGYVLAEFYAANPYDLAIEPLVADLVAHPLQVDQDGGFRIWLTLSKWQEGMTPDYSQAVARLRFKVNGTIDLEER